jgi:hypothetical protein
VNDNPPASANPDCASRWKRQACACAGLTLVVVAAFPVFAWYGYISAGTTGIAAAAVAAGVCWLGAMIALVIAGISDDPPKALSAVLAGMIFRLGLPLAAGLLLRQYVPSLAAAGVFGMILCYYFITLIADTLFLLRLIAPLGKVREAS